MKKKPVKNSKRNTGGNKHLKTGFLFLFITCGLIFFPPFFRGLYFEREFNIVHIISFALILFWIVLRYRDKSYTLIRFKYEYFLFALVAVYFITIPFAASARGALEEALKYANYLAVYILVRDLIDNNSRNTEIFLNTIIAGVSAVSLVGLMNYLGFMSNNGALVGNRISSTIQYPNTLAVVIGAAIFITISMMMASGRKLKLVYTAALNILLITFVLTFSRTMWLMLPFLMIIYFFAVPREKKLEGLALTLISAVFSLAAAGLLTGYMGEGSFASVLIVLASMLASVGLGLAYERLKPVALSNRTFGILIAAVILVSGVVGTAVLNITEPLELSHKNMEDGYINLSKNIYSIEGEGHYKLELDVKTHQLEDKPWLGRVSVYSIDRGQKSTPLKHYYIREQMDGIIDVPFSTLPDTYYIRVAFYNYYKDTGFAVRDAKLTGMPSGRVLEDIKLGYKYLPDALSARIDSINIKNNSMQARISFFRDAFSIIRDNFILGLGGKGWNAAYRVYRTSEYWTREAHSYPIQLWVETGTIGFLAAVGFLIAFAAAAFKRRKEIADGKDGMRFTGVIFSILAILLHSLIDFDLTLGSVSILLWSCIALSSGWSGVEELKAGQPGFLKGLSAGLALVLLAASISLTSAARLNYKAAIAVNSNDMAGAESSVRTAVRLDPLNTDYRTNLARLVAVRGDLQAGEQYRQAGEQLEKAIANDSFNYALYGEMAMHQYRYGRFDKAVEYIDRAIDVNPAVPGMYSQKMDLLLNISRHYMGSNDRDNAEVFLEEANNVKEQITYNNEKLARPVEVDAELMHRVYRVNFILDNINDKNVFDQAGSVAMYETFDFDSGRDGLPDLWQIPYQDDKVVRGGIVKDAQGEVFEVVSDSSGFYIQRLDLSLQPSSRYLIALEGRSKSGNGKMTAIVLSSSGKSEQFRENSITMGSDYTLYQNTFETTDDIEPNNQYIRLYFSDKEGEVVLRRAILIRLE